MDDDKIMEKMNPEELLRGGKSISVSPEGYSMYPLLVPGRDRVLIEPLSSKGGAGHPKRGDIVLFRRINSILVLHRICRVKNDGFYLVGDNQVEIEGPVKEEQLCGIVTEIIRKGKSISTNKGSYRFLTGFWLFIRPLRPAISKTVHALKKVFGKGGRQE